MFPSTPGRRKFGQDRKGNGQLPHLLDAGSGRPAWGHLNRVAQPAVYTWSADPNFWGLGA